MIGALVPKEETENVVLHVGLVHLFYVISNSGTHRSNQPKWQLVKTWGMFIKEISSHVNSG